MRLIGAYMNLVLTWRSIRRGVVGVFRRADPTVPEIVSGGVAIALGLMLWLVPSYLDDSFGSYFLPRQPHLWAAMLVALGLMQLIATRFPLKRYRLVHRLAWGLAAVTWLHLGFVAMLVSSSAGAAAEFVGLCATAVWGFARSGLS